VHFKVPYYNINQSKKCQELFSKNFVRGHGSASCRGLAAAKAVRAMLRGWEEGNSPFL